MLLRRDRAVTKLAVVLTATLLTTLLGGCQMSGMPFVDLGKDEHNKRNEVTDIAVAVVEQSDENSAVSSSNNPWYSGLMPSESPPTKIEQLLLNNQLVEAEVLLKQRLNNKPRDIQSRTNLGILLAKSDRPSEAMSELQQVVRAQPHYCPAQSQLAQLFKIQFEIERAEAAYLSCLSENPNYLPALLNIGVLNELYLGDLDAALKFYSRYQLALIEPDEQVAHWITDLNRRIAVRGSRSGNDATQLAEVALPSSGE